ncbi:unnamed protein product [Rhizophagus irregularis]|nr:unnamed protein product [Rhizophagus irregularis]
MMAYNLSPSFNWDATGMTDEEIRTYISDLGNSDNPKNRLQDWEFIKQEEFQISGPVVFPTVQYGYA